MLRTTEPTDIERASGELSASVEASGQGPLPRLCAVLPTDLKWFRPRGYRHLDAPVGQAFARKVEVPKFVAEHSWLPLIHYKKRTKRYKRRLHKTPFKDRPIMYASHRDACILSRYAALLAERLETLYRTNGLERNVIAYRKLGRANYDFAADAMLYAKDNAPCVAMCFDISGFFDHLDHRILKRQLKSVLEVEELPPDWYRVFRNVTAYRKIDLESLKAHPVIAERFRSRSRRLLGTIAELRKLGIKVHSNPNRYGIPQGTPISSALSNAYLLAVDLRMRLRCQQVGALYQRYSDDILILCGQEHEVELRICLEHAIKEHKLSLSSDKFERAEFDKIGSQAFQYLGFEISPCGARIRSSSLSRQWRKAKRAIARAARIGTESVQAGIADKIYTKKLRHRFQSGAGQNFSSYARNSAKALRSKKILRQIRAFERATDAAIRSLNS